MLCSMMSIVFLVYFPLLPFLLHFPLSLSIKVAYTPSAFTKKDMVCSSVLRGSKIWINSTERNGL